MQQGKISNVQFIPFGDGVEVAVGMCVEHPNTRLIGHQIRTSRVVSKREGGFTTRNTDYTIVP